MGRLVIVLYQNIDKTINNFEFYDDDYIVGVEKGANILLDLNIKYNLLIGDFDSVSNEEYDIIKSQDNVIKLNPIKDDTDLLSCLKRFDLSEFNEIIVLGGITGNRVEHFYANILLLRKYNFKMIDDNSVIFPIFSSINLNKANIRKYISFFALDNVDNLCLNGFKYNLSNYHLDVLDTVCISNEILDNVGKITFDSGKLLCITSF